MQVPSQQALPLFTDMLAGKFDEFKEVIVTNLGRSYFPAEKLKTRFIKTSVRRANEDIALDVILGHQGLRTQISKYVATDYDPFYYKYYFDATQLEIYFRLFGSNSWNTNDMQNAADEFAVPILANKQLIERAYELQTWQILNTGTCTSYKNPAAPVVINFNRLSASMLATPPSGFWDTTNGCDPFGDMEAGGIFLRTTGLIDAFEIDVIMGTAAYTAFINTNAYKTRSLALRYTRDDVRENTKQLNGAVYHGTFDINSYRANVYTYPQFYNDPTNLSGPKLPYMPPKNVVMLSASKNPLYAQLYHIATPQIVKGFDTMQLVAGDYIYSDYLDVRSKTHEFYVESGGIPVPKRIDAMFTMQAHS